jgi:hypothetical protein
MIAASSRAVFLNLDRLRLGYADPSLPYPVELPRAHWF